MLSPGDRAGNTGRHYLVMKPVVDPGVKSVNTTVTVVSIAAQCKYWNESEFTWSEDGCRVGTGKTGNCTLAALLIPGKVNNNRLNVCFSQVGPLTTPLVTQCLCNHLTFFGSSFFVMPNLVDVSRTAELFATFTNNPVVVCFVGALFVVYLLVAVWARRKDIQDSAKVNIIQNLALHGNILHFSVGSSKSGNTFDSPLKYGVTHATMYS